MAPRDPDLAALKKSTKSEAVARVDAHVFPKPCFVWYVNNQKGWSPIPGTGCAHYVSHQLGIKGVKRACDAGYLFRVPDVVAGLVQVKNSEVQVGDIWTNLKVDHTGLVVEVKPDPKNSKLKQIVIEHCSSRQRGVVRNDWKTFFGGQGNFFRPRNERVRQRSEDKTTARNSTFPVREAFL